jgi:hypothetical protein
LVRLAMPAALATAAAAVPVLILRFALWGGHRSLGQTVAELVLWGAGLVLWTWLLERGLLRELFSYIRVRTPPAAGFVAGARG